MFPIFDARIARIPVSAALVLPLFLAACGGGGGDGAAPVSGARASAPASGGIASAPLGGGADVSPPPSDGGPQAFAFKAFDPVNVGGARSLAAPATARLGARGSVIVWSETGSSVMARIVDNAGAVAGDAFAVNPGETRAVDGLSVAAAPDGGFVVTWVAYDFEPATPGAAASAIHSKRFAADGSVVGESRVGGTLFQQAGATVVKSMADGGFVAGWTAKLAQGGPSSAWLQRLDANGAPAGPRVLAADPGGEQSKVVPLPLADGAVLAVWEQATSPGFVLQARRFTGDLQSPGTAVTVSEAHASPFPFSAAPLAGGGAAVAWALIDRGAGVTTVRSTVLTAAGSAAAAQTVEHRAAVDAADAAVVSLGSGFGVVWQVRSAYPRGSSAGLWLQRRDAAGQALDEPALINGRAISWVSPTQGTWATAGDGFGFDGGSDGHLVGAVLRADDRPNAYLFGL